MKFREITAKVTGGYSHGSTLPSALRLTDETHRKETILTAPDRDLLMNNSVSTERISTSPRTVYKLFTTLARCCVLLRDRTFSRTGHRTTVLLRQLMAEDGNRIVVVVVVVVVVIIIVPMVMFMVLP